MEHVKEHSDGQAGKRIDERREARQRGNQAPQDIDDSLTTPCFPGRRFPQRGRGRPDQLSSTLPTARQVLFNRHSFSRVALSRHVAWNYRADFLTVHCFSL